MLGGIIFVVETQVLEFFYLEDTFIVIGGSLLNHGSYVLLIRSSDWQFKFFHGSGKASF